MKLREEHAIETKDGEIHIFPDGKVALVPEGYVCIPEHIYERLYQLERELSVKLSNDIYVIQNNLNVLKENIYREKHREYLFEDAKMNFADYVEDEDYILSDEDYWKMVEMYEKEEDQNIAPYYTWLWVIEEFLKSTQENFYVTFGSWEGFPYQNTYLIVRAKDSDEAIEKFRVKYPDKTPNTFCFSEMYPEDEWQKSAISTFFRNKKPVDVIS